MRRENNRRKKSGNRFVLIIVLLVLAVTLFMVLKIGLLNREPTISFSSDKATVYIGAEQKLKVSYDPADKEKPALEWSSSDTDVAVVKSSGVIVPKAKGTADITARTKHGQKITCTVTVKKPVKTVFLTFDDGPSANITPKLLKLLRDNDVHATFFLIGYEAKDNEDLVKEAYKDGNTIGIHTYTHEYTTIYANEDAFFADFDKTEKLLKKITGKQPTVCRMPGGSVNGYCSLSLSRTIVKKLRARGYKCTDWNVSFGDSSLTDTTVKTMYHRVVRDIKPYTYPVILAHDSEQKETSYETAKKLIKYFKAKHYAFSTIDKYPGEPPIFIQF
ncbi:MAG: polysaccharide deacetylase family protein [Eubacteriaceae bacterium]|jgi:peptidoglycan/xylan/chitin deacetylase (PgdA/CDA1 family)|nr:polysaccharide deacetylase family protein [Eubacteriaceae bacterium]